MMVTVTALVKRNDQWWPDKSVECSDEVAQVYVDMFLKQGYEKVRVR